MYRSTTRLLPVGLLTLGTISMAVTSEIGFIEDFVLAPDRSVALKQLIPGTEDYYYYHCLHYQNVQQYDKVEPLLTEWIRRHNVTSRVREIQHRQALLTYPQDAGKTLEYLRDRLGLRFDHQRDALDRAADLPTQLDPSLISREHLLSKALKRHRDNLNGCEDSALEWLAGKELDASRRRDLLKRLRRPDVAGLAERVVDDLNAPNSPGFGDFAIHKALLQSQLDMLLQLRPALRNESKFVTIYLSKLRPNPDVNWRHEPQQQRAYLERLWAFASTLAPAHNSLKAHVLYHRLALDMSQGVYDQNRFMTYLRLPRPVSYVNPRYLRQPENRNAAANLGEDFRAKTSLPPVGDDEAVVRAYLQHFFSNATDYKVYEPYVRDVYLKHLFAETKIVNGLGNPQQWYSLLPPDQYQQLKERVDLDFAATNPRRFDTDESVGLDVDVKNVSTLMIKVYRIHAGNFYKDHGREISTAINLDGLVANEEFTFDYDDPPLRRIRRHYDFPSLSQPGLYIIDLIGNGKNSRALIQKGKLHYLVRTTPAGHAFTILDDQNRKLDEALLWMGGQTYTAQANGQIFVPYSTQPGTKRIVLMHGPLVSLDTFHHAAETYTMSAGLYVDRESLLSGRVAQLLVRPGIRLNDMPVSVGLLENARLEITCVDLDDVSTSDVVTDPQLSDEQDFVHELRVPPRLASIHLRLAGRVKSLSENKQIDLQTTETYAVNQIETTPAIEDLHLRLHDQGYWLEVRGKTGEPKANRVVQLSLKHRDFRDPAVVTLRSDERGRVDLGWLEEIVWVAAKGVGDTEQRWPLLPDRQTYPRSVHGIAGSPIEIPFAVAAQDPSPDALSLLEVRNGTYVADWFQALSVRQGMLWIQNLPVGDYDLLLKPLHQRMRIRVTAGPIETGYALGSHRQLELRGSRPLHIESIAISPEKLTAQLRNVSPQSRVHVFASELEPAFDSFEILANVRNAEPTRGTRAVALSLYLSGRQIGDELRYILERKYADKFPGNMLPRPELLLNAWAIRDTQTGVEELAEDEAMPDAEPESAASRKSDAASGEDAAGPSDFANVDFLAKQSGVVLNVKPDEQGRVDIDRTLLAGKSCVRFVAVDLVSTSQRTVLLPTSEPQILDLRLLKNLDPAKPYSQQKQISLVDSGQDFEVEDLRTGRFQIYDSLAKLFQLYETLHPDPKLNEFRFVLRWHKLTDDEKRELYDKYACHELNFFISRKDPDFFQSSVAPYLGHKLHKTFLDHYLLEDDLSGFLAPWNYQRLNVVERVLLARRIAGEQPVTADHLTQLWNLIPPDIDHFNRLFDTAILGRALAADGQDGLEIRALSRAKRPELTLAFDMDAAGVEKGARLQEREEKRASSERGRRSSGRFMFGIGVNDSDLSTRVPAAGAEAESRDGESATYAGKRVDVDFAYSDFDAFGEFRKLMVDKQLYQALDQTKEWVENNYYHLPISQQNAELVTVNAFWLDFARHAPDQAFLSPHLAEASRNFTEMMLALAVLDLPAESPQHEVNFSDISAQVKPAGPGVVFHQQVRPTSSREDGSPVLVSQNFFRHDDRYQQIGNERIDKFVTDEFLVQTVYGAQIVATNPTSAPAKLDILIQVPEGAIPVLNGHYTRNVHLKLEPYRTQSIEYFFYFPLAGQFSHYPVHVAKGESLVAAAAPIVFNVVREPTQVDQQSWQYVSQYGSDEDVLQYLQTQNLHAVELDRIAFRMGDLDVFQKTIDVLTRRHAYNNTLWSYGIRHNQPEIIEQFLRHADEFAQQCGALLQSPLLTIDPVERKTYEHMEYRPLVNARSHQVGKRRQILNDRFHEQYHRWLQVLSYLPELQSQDQLATVYYLLLQDRVAQATQLFRQVDRSRVQTRLQYDYCAAYLNMNLGDTQQARAIIQQYDNYPIDHWRDAFALVRNHLDEIEGRNVQLVDSQDRDQVQDELAAAEPSFDFTVESKTIQLEHRNLEQVQINYYLMDIELLFSRNPFVQRYSGQFSYIQPNMSQTVSLTGREGSQVVSLPEQLHNQNLLVEIEAAGVRRSQPYFSHSLSVQLIENYGQLQVADAASGSPLSTVYVKVYALLDGDHVQFYKDGYTDLRGRFDYSSLSTNTLDAVERFAILVLSEDKGAVVREASPPQR